MARIAGLSAVSGPGSAHHSAESMAARVAASAGTRKLRRAASASAGASGCTAARAPWTELTVAKVSRCRTMFGRGAQGAGAGAGVAARTACDALMTYRLCMPSKPTVHRTTRTHKRSRLYMYAFSRLSLCIHILQAAAVQPGSAALRPATIAIQVMLGAAAQQAQVPATVHQRRRSERYRSATASRHFGQGSGGLLVVAVAS